MTDMLTSTVVDSLAVVATRRSEIEEAAADMRAELDHLDALEQWLNAYPQLPKDEEETPADRGPEPDSPPPAAPASPARPEGPPPAARATVPPRAQSARDADAKVLSTVVSSNRPLAKTEIAERSGIKGERLDGAIRRLVQSGGIIAEGATRSRRFRRDKDHQPHTAAGRKVKAAREAGAKRLDDNVKRVGLRERVLKAIAADPRKLTAGFLAQRLEAHPDDITEALDKLVEQGKVVAIEGDRPLYVRAGQTEVG